MNILAYHMVDSRFDWGITRVTPFQFRRQIERALELNYRFQTLSDYLEDESGDRKRIALTFDDGYESVYTFAYPTLQEYGIAATVFVIAGYTGQFNTWDVNIGWRRFKHLDWTQIRELDHAKWEIGSHGMLHRDLTRLRNVELVDELQRSKQLLENHVDHFNAIISYPFGNVDRRVWNACIEKGYRTGVVMGNPVPSIPERFCVPRTGIYLFDSLGVFEQKIQNRFSRIYQSIQKVMDICSDGSVIVKKRNWY